MTSWSTSKALARPASTLSTSRTTSRRSPRSALRCAEQQRSAAHCVAENATRLAHSQIRQRSDTAPESLAGHRMDVVEIDNGVSGQTVGSRRKRKLRNEVPLRSCKRSYHD